MNDRPGPTRTTFPTSANSVIEAIAARQHGVVSRAQLIGAGIAEHTVDYRVRTGSLQSLYRGVYGVGPVEAPLRAHMAAVLACGTTAVVSHRTASTTWWPPRRKNQVRRAPRTVTDRIEISTTRGRRQPGPDILVHRVASLAPDEVTRIEGIPITTRARTVLDLAGTVGPRELEQALARADRDGSGVRSDLEALLRRHPRRRGSARLRALLTRDAAPAFTRSEAEAQFLSLVRKARLPEPHVNVPVAEFEVDFLWPTERLVVEVDGFEFHSAAPVFQSDRRRGAVLTAAGYRVVRVTWRQLTQEPLASMAALAQALVRAGEGRSRP